MPFLRRALWLAARQIAANPAVQEKAAEIVRDDVAPRVRRAVARAKPEIEAARRRAETAADDLRDAARRHPPLRDPAGFLRDSGRRFRRRRDPSDKDDNSC